MLKTLFFMPLAAVFQGGATPEASAQEQEPAERKVRVEIVTTENGETKRITKEFDATNDAEIQHALKELGVLDQINVGGDGENVTIDIRRSGGDAGDDVFMHMAPMPPMQPMPPMPPMPPIPGSDGSAYLGVSTRSLDNELIKEYKLNVNKGVLVDEVMDGSAAEIAGIEDGDVITEVDGKAILGTDELIAMIRAHKAGDEVKLTWYHEGKKKNGAATLGERVVRSYSYSYGPEHGSEWYDWEAYLGDGEGDIGPRAFLGVTPGDDNGPGASIGSVEEGTAAAKMGVMQGDRITKIDQESIDDFADLSETVKAMQPGDAVTVTVQRDGKAITMNGELGEHSVDRTHSFNFHGDAPEGMMRRPGMGQQDFAELQRDMAELQRDMAELQRSLGKDMHTKDTRITIEALPLSSEEKALLKSKGVSGLDTGLKLGDLRAFPNPSNGFFRLQFDVAEKGDLFVNVHDAKGEKVYEERITGFKGRYERTLDLTDKATGTYYLVIEQRGKSTAQKLIKQ